jgi:hypothetical protein
VAVLQVGRGVAVEGQHAVPVEDVVADPVRGQVGVLHGADADGTSHLAARRRIEILALVGHHGGGPLDRLVEQVDEPQRLASP